MIGFVSPDACGGKERRRSRAESVWKRAEKDIFIRWGIIGVPSFHSSFLPPSAFG
jgi:hypothetical protein